MTISFDPFREMDRLTRGLFSAATQGEGPRWMPMDLYRQGDHYVASIDLPGVDPGSIDVDVEGNTLTVRARRTARSEDTEWLTQERPSGTFMRQLTLGEGLDLENIHADYQNGVLSMTIPIAAQAKARKIQVQAGTGKPEQIGRSQEPAQGQVAGESTAE